MGHHVIDDICRRHNPTLQNTPAGLPQRHRVVPMANEASNNHTLNRRPAESAVQTVATSLAGSLVAMEAADSTEFVGFWASTPASASGNANERQRRSASVKIIDEFRALTSPS